MARIYTASGSESPPELDPKAVADFFENRARRIDEVGPIKAVIYQDKQGDLAERRDRAEMEKLLPLLELNGTQHFLDIGCGTGRWAGRLASLVNNYHGIDFNSGFIDYAQSAHTDRKNCRFSKIAAESLSAFALNNERFDRILCAGLMIYMNDNQLHSLLKGMSEVAMPSCRILLREPVGINKRLTLTDHYSEELEDSYSAIYRTEQELTEGFIKILGHSGFKIIDRGDVHETSMNNRSDTIQRWYLLERSS